MISFVVIISPGDDPFRLDLNNAVHYIDAPIGMRIDNHIPHLHFFRPFIEFRRDAVSRLKRWVHAGADASAIFRFENLHRFYRFTPMLDQSKSRLHRKWNNLLNVLMCQQIASETLINLLRDSTVFYVKRQPATFASSG